MHVHSAKTIFLDSQKASLTLTNVQVHGVYTIQYILNGKMSRVNR